MKKSELIDVFEHKRYPNFPNVTSRHQQGRLTVEISPVGNYHSYVFGLLLTSAIFLWLSWMFASAIIQAITKAGLTTGLAYSLPFVAFLFLWFFVGARIILKRLSSIELSAGDGVFKWTQRTFRWTTVITVPQQDVTAVTADAKWYRKTLKLTLNGTVYAVDDLLADDLESLTRELRLRLGITNAPVDR